MRSRIPKVLAILCLFSTQPFGDIQQHAYSQDETIVVTTSLDANDFGGLQTTDDLPGPDGRVSFREACIAANNTSGPQTIHFEIPVSDWHPLSDEMALLQLEDGAYSLIDDQTTVDFSTQTLFTGDTNPNGKEVGIYGFQPNGLGTPAIFVFGNHCKIIGLGSVFQRGYAVSLTGNFNRIEDCVINGTIHDSLEINGGFNGPPATGNVIGGTEPGQANILRSLLIAASADDNLIIGNEFNGDGIRVAGSFNLNLHAVNNRIGGINPGEGNIFYGAGNYSSEGFPLGTNIHLFETENTYIQGNTIGLLPDGVTPSNQVAPTGIEVRASLNTVVSDNVVVAMKTNGINHFAGQTFGRAIVVQGDSEGIVLQRNRVGISIDDQVIPNLNGIVVANFQGAPTNTLIGGMVEDGNIITGSDVTGVSVHAPATGISILGNRIFGSGSLGIDLDGNGITLNDDLDTDTGGNNRQNFPEIVSTTSDGSLTHVDGVLESLPNTEFLLEFFSNPGFSSTGYGEGENFLGRIQLTTDESGVAPFDTSFPVASSAGQFVSATATNLATGDTSEFAIGVEVEATDVLPGDVNLDGIVDLLDVAPFIDRLNSGVFQAEADVNQDGNVDLLDVGPFVDLLSS